MRTLFISLIFGLIVFPCRGQTPAALAKSYETAAAASFASGDYEKSMEFFSKAFPYLQKDPALIAAPGLLLTHAVKILIQQQLPSEALGILRAIDIPAVAAKHDNIDPEQIILGKGDSFYAMNEPDSALRYYRDAMRFIPNPGFSKYKVVAYESLANFYTGTRQYAKARPLLDTLTATTNRAAVPVETRAIAFYRLFQIDSATQNYREALAQFRQYQLLQDTLNAIAKNRQIAENNSAFETEMKIQFGADRAGHAALQTQLAQTNKNKNYLFIAATLLLLVLAAALYSRYQIRRRLAANLDTLEQTKHTHLDEKQQLRREIHQRALNHLQTTITLLPSQRKNPELPALVLAHKKLTAAPPDTTTINMREYIRELITTIRQDLALQRPIVWRLDLAAVDLDITQCVPLGIILEAAVTNSILHAFCSKDVPSPTIHISLKEEPDNNLILLIADNGIGLPAGPDPNNPTTAGLQIIQTLTRQLDGTVELINKDGLTIRIRYPCR